jgi:hypothetical protein
VREVRGRSSGERPSHPRQTPAGLWSHDWSLLTDLKSTRAVGESGDVAHLSEWGVATMVPIVPVQCWIARMALDWTVTDLARAAEVSRDMVRKFERGGSLRELSGRLGDEVDQAAW